MTTAKRKRTRAARPPKAVTLTRKQLADLLVVHPMTVTKWEQAGLPVAVRGRKGKPSLYDEAKVRAWLQAREDAAKSSGIVDVAAARARKELSQALESEQRVLIKAGTHHPLAEQVKEWTAELQGCRTVILATYTQAAEACFRAGQTGGVAGVAAFLADLADQVLRELGDEDRPFPADAEGEGEGEVA